MKRFDRILDALAFIKVGKRQERCINLTQAFVGTNSRWTVIEGQTSEGTTYRLQLPTTLLKTVVVDGARLDRNQLIYPPKEE